MYVCAVVVGRSKASHWDYRVSQSTLDEQQSASIRARNAGLRRRESRFANITAA